MILGNVTRNEFDINVGVESLSQVLSDCIKFVAICRLAVFLTDMLVDNQETVANLLFVHTIKCSFSVFGIFEANVSDILRVSVKILLNTD